MRWCPFRRLRRKACKGSQRQCLPLFRRTNHRLQSTHHLRLPRVRLGLLRLAESHKTIVRQVADLRGRNHRGLALSRLFGWRLPRPKLTNVRLDLLKSDPLNGRRSSEETFVHHRLAKTYSIE